jgi:hypothetical protein
MVSTGESMAPGAKSARESIVSGTAYTANNITNGTLIFAVIMGFIIFSRVIYKGVKDRQTSSTTFDVILELVITRLFLKLSHRVIY